MGWDVTFVFPRECPNQWTQSLSSDSKYEWEKNFEKERMWVSQWMGRIGWCKGNACIFGVAHGYSQHPVIRRLLVQFPWPVLHIKGLEYSTPKLLLMCWSAPCMAATASSVWITVSHFQRNVKNKYLFLWPKFNRSFINVINCTWASPAEYHELKISSK